MRLADLPHKSGAPVVLPGYALVVDYAANYFLALVTGFAQTHREWGNRPTANKTSIINAKEHSAKHNNLA
ncbi:MAG: hypothetical protein NT154_36655 [Verrucomicrobia bacterium]|nr:hypothetical protein [Verrucomicrobiota bacterium]